MGGQIHRVVVDCERCSYTGLVPMTLIIILIARSHNETNCYTDSNVCGVPLDDLEYSF